MGTRAGGLTSDPFPPSREEREAAAAEAEAAAEEEDADAGQDEQEPVELDGKTYKDPEAKIRALESEKTRHAVNAKKARAERDAAVAELEQAKRASSAEGLKEARMESAFYRELLKRKEPVDAETTWDLLHVRGFVDTITVNEDGTVEGMDAALEKLFDRYPWLLDGYVEIIEEEEGEPKRRTAPPPRKRRDSAGDVPTAASVNVQRFPSLAKGRKPR
jgi:hypothetical protein